MVLKAAPGPDLRVPSDDAVVDLWTARERGGEGGGGEGGTFSALVRVPSTDVVIDL